MIVFLFRAPVEPGQEKEFEQGFARRARLVDQAPGFVSLRVLRPEAGQGYIVLTKWEGQEAYESWLKSGAFAQAHGGKGANAAPKPMIDTYTVIDG